MAVMQLSGRVADLEDDGVPEQVRFRMFDSFTSFADGWTGTSFGCRLMACT
jgi:hypothetical protein